MAEFMVFQVWETTGVPPGMSLVIMGIHGWDWPMFRVKLYEHIPDVLITPYTKPVLLAGVIRM